ncbi:MAG: hypothetical protein HZB21_01290 [Deltaproteobacteria bacterium]|nr:hypothetical protein [Deltaproteobacteria bacterium]
MSSSLWRDIEIKKGLGGVGDVTEAEKDAIIEKAVAQWEKMGLTQNEMAFGIATMNVESGFNPHVKGTSETEYGLGQFNDITWRPAVKEYNDKYRGKTEHRIYPDVSRDDPDAQIKVMGAWIRKVWEKYEKIALDPKLKDYDPVEVAYSIWNKGINKSVDGLKTYLNDADEGYKKKKAGIRLYLNNTYFKAHDALDVRDILSPVNKRRSKDPSGTKTRQFRGSGSGSGETLRRDNGDYRMVWRIEPEGGTRGYFISDD